VKQARSGRCPLGLRLAECFKPFLRNLPARRLSRQTLRRHRDNVWVLGGKVIRALQIDSDLRRRPIEQLVRNLISEDGGPLLSHGQSEAEQRAFDATCRKLSRFLADPQISRGQARNTGMNPLTHSHHATEMQAT
jgi:hypothetical protein